RRTRLVDGGPGGPLRRGRRRRGRRHRDLQSLSSSPRAAAEEGPRGRGPLQPGQRRPSPRPGRPSGLGDRRRRTRRDRRRAPLRPQSPLTNGTEIAWPPARQAEPTASTARKDRSRMDNEEMDPQSPDEMERRRTSEELPAEEGDERTGDRPPGAIRAEDIEPYFALQYVARLFKIAAMVVIVALTAEVVAGIALEGAGAILPLFAEVIRG